MEEWMPAWMPAEIHGAPDPDTVEYQKLEEFRRLNHLAARAHEELVEWAKTIHLENPRDVRRFLAKVLVVTHPNEGLDSDTIEEQMSDSDRPLLLTGQELCSKPKSSYLSQSLHDTLRRHEEYKTLLIIDWASQAFYIVKAGQERWRREILSYSCQLMLYSYNPDYDMSYNPPYNPPHHPHNNPHCSPEYQAAHPGDLERRMVMANQEQTLEQQPRRQST
ncbi:hypothetical protein B0H63DRAFT_527553 [Podospora didyma]|uniref:Uncharacterized protein n=1 Tax=Podospora didyma TaxID=330526 RepID=A0AAE0KB30_9PEZI|nr:hypothetical protein B0H63DRAFT_527553 [Podospora didyma]